MNLIAQRLRSLFPSAARYGEQTATEARTTHQRCEPGGPRPRCIQCRLGIAPTA